MARTPKLRINFESDVQYLLRLKHAIEDDIAGKKDDETGEILGGWPAEWADSICRDIAALSMRLMQRPPKITSEELQDKRNVG